MTLEENIDELEISALENDDDIDQKKQPDYVKLLMNRVRLDNLSKPCEDV